MLPAAVLCDIEGTTSSLSFVHDILFPLSFERMEDFIHEHWNGGEIQDELRSIKQVLSKNDVNPDEVITLLQSWIQQDRKEGALKSIQGKIWKESFESGKIRGHVYPDVPLNFEKWNRTGMKIAIFSSGSVEAQKLLFKYSIAGDLSKFIYAYYDTSTGSKKEASSYEAIANHLTLATNDILFLSDVETELDAARTARMKAIQVLREGVTPNSSDHPVVRSFDEIN